MENFIPTKEVARIFDVSGMTVRGWIRRGFLETRKESGQVLISVDSLQAFVNIRAARLQSKYPRPEESKRRITIADAAGVFEGPGDLSVNPKYMEGYGK